MIDLSATELVNLILATMALLPAGVLVNQYRRTGVQDYLLFGGTFILFFVMLLATVIGSITNLLILMQIHHWCYNILFFFLFLQAVRMRWDFAPRFIWYLGVIWCSILVFLIFFWELMAQPDRAVVLFLEMPHGHSSYYPDGAGFMTSGGIIIYSTAHNILRVLYSIYIWILLLYAHWTVKPVYSSDRIILARRLMICAVIAGFIYLILCLPWFPYVPLLNAFLILVFLVIAYVSIRIPEGLLISQTQILRVVKLYKEIKNLTSKQAVQRFGMPSLIDYLQNIPPELLGQTWESLEQE